jgi:signal transduction histidine kinase
MRIRQVSLQIKIIIALSGIIIFLLLFSTELNLKFLRNSLENSLADTAILLAKQIDATIESKRRLEDPALLKREVFEIIQMRRHIENIDIYLFYPANVVLRHGENKEYRVLIASDTTAIVELSAADITILRKNQLCQRMKFEPEQPRLLEIIVPLHLKRQVIGAITIITNFQETDRLLVNQKRQSYIIVCISLLVIVPLLIFYLHTTVNRPIQQLIHAMSQVETNQLPNKVNIARKDELGYLAENFNRMVDRLAKAEQERTELLARISLFNEELQTKVQETTRELAFQHDELKRAHAQFVLIQHRLIDADKLATLGQVAATIAHEVGTPLGAVSGHIQLLREQYKDDIPAIERLDIIDKQVNRVVSIIQDLLNSVRERTAEFVPVSLNQLVQELVTLVSPQLTQQQVKLQTELESRLPDIFGNADQLQQVLLNLVDNALDAMPNGGKLTISVRVDPDRTSQNQRTILVELSDSGSGIMPEHISHIFNPFFSTKSPGEGTGLGLSVCKDIVEKHNGTISVKSIPNQGTKFMIQFPVKEGTN